MKALRLLAALPLLVTSPAVAVALLAICAVAIGVAYFIPASKAESVV